MEGNHSKAGEVGGVALAWGSSGGQRKVPPMWTHRGNHGHRKIKGGKHVRWSLKRGENFQREQYSRFNTLKSHAAKKAAKRPRMKSEYSIEEMVQSAAQSADREIQERRACAEGQCGICPKCQTGRRSRQTATAEEANNGASFTDENRPAKGWDSCMCT